MLNHQQIQAWNDHWKNTGAGSINLFEDSPVANALRGFWWPHLAWIGQVKVLDIGAGSGMLAGLALQQKIKVSNWLCLDPAESAKTHWPKQNSALYDPNWIVGSLESVAPTAKVDAIVSNFGIEYSDLQQAPAKIKAWASDEVKLALVLHAKGSVIDEQSQQASTDLAFLLNQTTLKTSALALIEKARSLPSDPEERMIYGMQERDAYNNDVNRLKTYMGDGARRSPVLLQVLQLASQYIVQAQRTGASPDGFAQFLNSLEWETERLRQMQAAALDEQKILDLANGLAAAGFANLKIERILTEQPAQNNVNRLVAWAVSNS